MKRLNFPKPFEHNHAPVRELCEIDSGPTTRGENVADWVYKNNLRAEEESRAVLENLAAQDKALEVIYQELLELRKETAKPASK